MDKEFLRNYFEKIFNIPWENSQGEPDIDYVKWLENNLIESKEISNENKTNKN